MHACTAGISSAARSIRSSSRTTRRCMISHGAVLDSLHRFPRMDQCGSSISGIRCVRPRVVCYGSPMIHLCAMRFSADMSLCLLLFFLISRARVCVTLRMLRVHTYYPYICRNIQQSSTSVLSATRLFCGWAGTSRTLDIWRPSSWTRRRSSFSISDSRRVQLRSLRDIR